MVETSIDIVVVDDNEVLVSVLSEILKECGHSVRTASDGLGALAHIRDRKPDILLSDLNMPRMSGFELLSIVRRRYPRIKVIAMSSSFVGQSVPRDVAADAFYEKGASSVARLLQIVNIVRNEPEVRSSRVPTPMWVARSLLVSEGDTSVLFGCPECLRAYPHSINDEAPVHHRDCPHCRYGMQLAIVPPTLDINQRRTVSARS